MDADRFVVLDDRQWAELGAERREATLAALHSALMHGVGPEDMAVLCSGCGVALREVESWVQPVLRPTGRPVREPWMPPPGDESTLDLF